jgi:hypothetical protein
MRERPDAELGLPRDSSTMSSLAGTDRWLVEAIDRASRLLEQGDALGCLRVLGEADRVAVAQGANALRPRIAALAHDAGARGDAAAARKAERIIHRGGGRTDAPRWSEAPPPPSRPSAPAPTDSAARRSVAPFLIVAAVALAVTWIPLAAYELWLRSRGVWTEWGDDWLGITTYFGVSWLVPGVMLGWAAATEARNRGLTHPTRLGWAAGIAVAVVLMIPASVQDSARDARLEENWARVEMGMSREEVSRIMGEPHSVFRVPDMEGLALPPDVPRESWAWEDSTFSSYVVWFDHTDRVTKKNPP